MAQNREGVGKSKKSDQGKGTESNARWEEGVATIYQPWGRGGVSSFSFWGGGD